MIKKILITGSTGFLGSRLALYLKDRYELLLPTHAELNVSREEALRVYMEENRPDIVLHCAALSNTWYCEQHPEESHRVNVQGTVRVAKACKLTGAKLVFISSDQVYNGTPIPGPLKENELIQPVNVYGRHKLECEQRARLNLPESVGLRLTWMYDLPSSAMKLNANILVNLKKACEEHTCIKAATHEYRGVSNVWDVVKNIEKAVSLPGGIYNFGSGNSLNSYELFLQAAALLGLPAPSEWIMPDEERFCDSPRNLVMDCSLIEEKGICFPESLEGIKNALRGTLR